MVHRDPRPVNARQPPLFAQKKGGETPPYSQLCCRRDLVAVLGSGPTLPAPGGAWRLPTIGSYCGGKHVKRDTLFLLLIGNFRRLDVALGFFGMTLLAIRTAVVTTITGSILVALVLVARTALVAVLLLARVEGLVLLILILAIFLALAPLFFEAGAAFVEHAKIMVGELQIIFGLDPIASQLRVTGKRFVLLMKLRSVAALAIVLTVPRVRHIVRRALSAATTAPAAVLTIVDQT